MLRPSSTSNSSLLLKQAREAARDDSSSDGSCHLQGAQMLLWAPDFSLALFRLLGASEE